MGISAAGGCGGDCVEFEEDGHYDAIETKTGAHAGSQKKGKDEEGIESQDDEWRRKGS